MTRQGNTKHVIIVGAGIGGLATAMRLQATGRYQVTVLEKNATVGGRANIWEQDGYRFDTGPSLLLMTDVYRELFQACGADFDALVPLVKMEPNYAVHFGDGSALEMSSDLTRMVASLEAIEPGAASGYYRFLDDARAKYRIGRAEFVEKNFARAADFFTLPNLRRLGQLDALNNLYAHVSQFFTDERLRQAFSMQSMYLGLSPYDAPAVYALLAYTELAEDGLYYPQGGIYALPTAMAEVARKLGVDIQLNCAVTEIVTENGRVRGVCVERPNPRPQTGDPFPDKEGVREDAILLPPFLDREGGRADRRGGLGSDAGRGSDDFLPADVVVCNADLPYAYTDLLTERPARYEEASWEKQAFTASAFMLYLGTDKAYPELRHHNFFLSQNYRRNFDEIFHAKVPPRDPSFYVNCPARTDPSVAPPGGDNLFVLVPIPHLTAQQTWSAEQVTEFKERVYQQLEARGLTDLRQHVKVERVVTPHDWQSQYNLKYGAAFGLSHGIMQVGYFRPPNKAPHVDNLYFVGASTVPGTGVPLVCLGAKLVCERIAADAA